MASLMIQGTGSDVGKSLLVAGLARALLRRGLSVAPFKPQNMSNNAAVAEGGEIGRAQALQARAAGLVPHTDMNPVLLKPESGTGAQIILQGQVWGRAQGRAYQALKPKLLPAVLESFERLRAAYDVVLVEGAGSPAEINLRAGDIANMGFARAAQVPVILAGDIDRGGVIAQIVGTRAVLAPEDAAMIRGFIINRFRGDPRLFDAGYAGIEDRSGWRGFGLVPWFAEAALLPAEDSVKAAERREGAGLHIAVPLCPAISNHDDLDPLGAEPGVRLTLVKPGEALPGDADLVILPGSKCTRADLAFFRAEGWDVDLAGHHRRGGQILGICGGYQMLGRKIADPEGVDGPPGEVAGLGYLDVETVMSPGKRVEAVRARALGADVEGYEIHMGRTTGSDTARPFAEVNGHPDGATSADGRVMGSYLHGLFEADSFRGAYLTRFGQTSEGGRRAKIEGVLDRLADHLEEHLDVDGLLSVAQAGV